MSTNEADLTFSRYCLTEAESERKRLRAKMNEIMPSNAVKESGQRLFKEDENPTN